MADDYLEWWVEEQFVEALEEADWLTLKADNLKRGWADRICFGPGATTVVVEFKRSGARKNRRGEKLQDHYRALFRALGFRTEKVTGMAEMEKLRDELLADAEGSE